MQMVAISILGLVVLVGTARSQDVVVPIRHVFAAPSSSSPLMSTPFRTQMMYDNSHFIAQGVTGPITINRLRFRARDGVPNLGGQVFTNLNVRLYDSPTTSTVWLISSALPSSTTDIMSTAVLTRDELTSGFSDAQRCFSLTFTSGPNVGLTRLIAGNGNDPAMIMVSAPFPYAPTAGDTFYVTRMPINYNNMASAYAANVGANVGSTEVIPSVTVGASMGTQPNNECVDLQLTTGAFTYDPTTMGNLVVELSCSTAPAPNATSLMDMAGAATTGIDLARCNRRAAATATVGSLFDNTATIHFGFTGAGGHPLANVGATVLSYGYPCGAQSSNAYQYFDRDPFDLRGLPDSSLTFTPDSVISPSNYIVTGGTTAVDLTQAVGPVQKFGNIIHTPGWAAPFRFVGGTTTVISASIEGFVWLANRGPGSVSDWTPEPFLWFGGGTENLPARVAPLWRDFSGTLNNLTHPGCGLYVNTDMTGGPGAFITYATWKDVAQNELPAATGGHSVNTFQCVFFEATGVIEFRYGMMSGCFGGRGITGFTQGTLGNGLNSTDPGSRDLSAEVPFLTRGPNGPQKPMTLTGQRPIVGTSTSLTVTNIPASHSIGLYVFDFAPSSPGYALPPVVDPGCILSIPLTPNWGFAIDFIGPSPGTKSMAGWPGQVGAPTWPLAFVGAHLYVQYASSASLLSGHATSNALDLRIGFN